MKIILTEAQMKSLAAFILESEAVDMVLDKINEKGINGLDERDKMILYGENNDAQNLSKIKLRHYFFQNGETFGEQKIKVRVKPIQQQHVKTSESVRFANDEGYLAPFKYEHENVFYVHVHFGGEELILIPIENVFVVEYRHDHIEPKQDGYVDDNDDEYDSEEESSY